MSISLWHTKSLLTKLHAGVRALCVTQYFRLQSTLINVDGDAPVVDMKNPFKKEQRKCILCRMNLTPDYKNVQLLSQFQSQYTGRLYGRHITGLCRKKQDLLEKEILKARMAGYMPFYHKTLKYHKDPKIFNPDQPLRRHKF